MCGGGAFYVCVSGWWGAEEGVVCLGWHSQAKNDLEAELQRQAAEKRKALEEKLKKARAARTVDHVAFKTMTFREAEDHLKKEGQVGDYIFRPSTSGVVKKDSPTLSLAWLFADKVRPSALPPALLPPQFPHSYHHRASGPHAMRLRTRRCLRAPPPLSFPCECRRGRDHVPS